MSIKLLAKATLTYFLALGTMIGLIVGASAISRR